MKKESRKSVTPAQITEDLWRPLGVRALISAVELGLFGRLSGGRKSASEIAETAGLHERSTTILLDCLTGMQYLDKKKGKYGLKPVSATFLDPAKPSYIGDLVLVIGSHWDRWLNLTEVVRTGQPVQAVDAEQTAREFFPMLVGSLFPLNVVASHSSIGSLSKKQRKKIRRVLDVAAGAAAWSIPYALEFPEARVTVVDYPEVMPIARGYAERFGVADRFDYVEGNIRELEFESDAFDIVILGHIIHSEGEEWGKKLIRKSFGALKKGGSLLIAELVPDDRRTGPVVPLIFGVNMLLNTESGNVFTMKEYRRWLRDAGFKRVSSIEAPAPSPLILATR